MKVQKYIVIVCCCSFGVANLVYPTSVGEKQERIRLVHADRLMMETNNNQDVWSLLGNVQLVQGEAFIHCDRARWWEKSDRAVLNGNVQIYDGKRTLKADSVLYRGQDRSEEAFGRVVLESGQRRLTSRRLKYYQDEELAIAKGDVVVKDFIEEATLTGNHVKYDQRLDYCFVEEQPRLVRVDSTSNDTLTVNGLKMEGWGDDQRILVSDSVQIWMGDLKAICQKAYYHNDKHLLILNELPILCHREQNMKGDTIDIYFEAFQFQGGTLRGNAEILSVDSLYTDILRGQRITIEAKNDTIDKVIVENQASSDYHVFDENGVYQGKNAVTGDRIMISLDGDRVRKIFVVSEPGLCTGTYTPKDTESTMKKENNLR